MTARVGQVRGGRGRRVRRLAPLLAMLAALTWAAAPANATIVDRERFTRTYDDIRWDCGYPMRVVGVESHTIHLRPAPKAADFAFFTDNYSFKETWTTADGRSFGLQANGIAKDVKATPLGDGNYLITFHQSGQPATITDSTGTVVSRDRGNLSFSFTFDTFLGVKLSGPHPLFEIGDLCKAVSSMVGTDSARYLTARPIGSTDFDMGFYEYLPPSYSTSGAGSPLLIALNGYGENGDGSPEAIRNLLFTGIPRFIDIGGWPTTRPLVVLALQHVEEAPGFPFEDCNGSCNMFIQHERDHASPAFCTTPDEVHDFITYAVGHYNVDPARVYITGLSCGAFGAWEYLAKYGDEQVAAAIPIAGEGRPAWDTAGCDLGTVAIWAIHGEFDDVVDPEGSIVPITNLRECAGVPDDRAKLTVYPDLFHDGWDQAYSGSLGDDIYSWMLTYTNP